MRSPEEMLAIFERARPHLAAALDEMETMRPVGKAWLALHFETQQLAMAMSAVFLSYCNTVLPLPKGSCGQVEQPGSAAAERLQAVLLMAAAATAVNACETIYPAGTPAAERRDRFTATLVELMRHGFSQLEAGNVLGVPHPDVLAAVPLPDILRGR